MDGTRQVSQDLKRSRTRQLPPTPNDKSTDYRDREETLDADSVAPPCTVDEKTTTRAGCGFAEERVMTARIPAETFTSHTAHLALAEKFAKTKTTSCCMIAPPDMQILYTFY